jgi:hypothetical protein
MAPEQYKLSHRSAKAGLWHASRQLDIDIFPICGGKSAVEKSANKDYFKIYSNAEPDIRPGVIRSVSIWETA